MATRRTLRLLLVILVLRLAPIAASIDRKNHHEYFRPKAAAAFATPPPGKRPPPQGGDMAYVRENIVRQRSFYDAIRSVGGPECCNDVYVRDPTHPLSTTPSLSSSFWYVGKVARCTGTVDLPSAVARQYNLIEEHAARLRPVELSRSFGSLEIWVAPADTELAVSLNDPTVPFERMERRVEGSDSVPLREVGFFAEVVTDRGAGFCAVRADDGTALP